MTARDRHRPAADAARPADALEDDYWASEIDLLVLRATDRLRRSGARVPLAELRRAAEAVVLDTARFVLDWVEGPRSARAVPDIPHDVAQQRPHDGAAA